MCHMWVWLAKCGCGLPRVGVACHVWVWLIWRFKFSKNVPVRTLLQGVPWQTRRVNQERGTCEQKEKCQEEIRVWGNDDVYAKGQQGWDLGVRLRACHKQRKWERPVWGKIQTGSWRKSLRT